MLLNLRSSLAVACSCMIFAIGGTAAASDASVAKQWGLFGIWKGNCSAPATPQDVRTRYYERQGRLYIELEWDVQPVGKGLAQIFSLNVKPVSIYNNSESFLEFRHRALWAENNKDGQIGRASCRERVYVLV